MPFKVDLNDLSPEQVPIEEKNRKTHPANHFDDFLMIFYQYFRYKLTLYFSLILDINTLYIMLQIHLILYLDSFF